MPRSIFRSVLWPEVLLEHFAVVTDLLHDLHYPVLGQLEVLAVLTIRAQQAGYVRVLGALGFGLDILRGDARLFGVEHGEQGPLDDAEPFFVALAHHRAQRFLGDGFRQYHVLGRRGQLGALGEQLRLVRGQHVATARLQRLGAFVRGVEGDRGVLQAIGAEVVRYVQLGGGTGLDADSRAIEFLGAGYTQLFVGGKPTPS